MRWSQDPPLPPAQRDRVYPQRLRLDARTGEVVGPPGLPSLSWPLPLRALADPDPLVGHAPVYWTDLPVGDHGPLLNAVVGSVWLTLRPHEWVDPASNARCARADVALNHHDGRRWRTIRRSEFSHVWELAPGESPRWADLLGGLADLASEHADELGAGREILRSLAGAILPTS